MTEDELILTHILQCSRSELYLRNFKLTDSQQKQFVSYQLRRKAGEPLQYILGVCDFMGIELTVDQRALIPRPETEVLVDEAIKRIKNLHSPKILDLGTGSGNIAIALLKFIEESFVTTVDVSKEALDLAKDNAFKHELEGRITFVQADMRDFLAQDKQQYDLIISNPPYIPINQMKTLPVDVLQEPLLALEAGEAGLDFYIDIIKLTPPLLRRKAYLMMEFGDGQEKAIKELSQDQFKYIQIIKDLTDRNRIIILRR
ncbi:MAG: peptide chain release factor N(5)-glutamine methyltransferase [Candidatus Omnitrophota bacterium]